MEVLEDTSLVMWHAMWFQVGEAREQTGNISGIGWMQHILRYLRGGPDLIIWCLVLCKASDLAFINEESYYVDLAREFLSLCICTSINKKLKYNVQYENLSTKIIFAHFCTLPIWYELCRRKTKKELRLSKEQVLRNRICRSSLRNQLLNYNTRLPFDTLIPGRGAQNMNANRSDKSDI